jgi:hypothetical protein
MKEFIKIPLNNLLVKNNNKHKKLFYQLVDEDGNCVTEKDSFVFNPSNRSDNLLFDIGQTFKQKIKYCEDYPVLRALLVEDLDYRSFGGGGFEVGTNFNPLEAEKTKQYTAEEIEACNLKMHERQAKDKLRKIRQNCEKALIALEKEIEDLDEQLGRK